jgi:hypothetical protein
MSDLVSVWQCKIINLRKKEKRWSKNRDAELKGCKQKLILDGLDLMVEQQGLIEVECEKRKELSLKLDKIWKIEETVTPRVSKPHDYANHMFMRL